MILFSASHAKAPLLIVGILMIPVAIVMLRGHFTLQPNEARVLILFGEYRGTVCAGGFFWANPFYSSSRNGAFMQLQAVQLAAAAAAKGGHAAASGLMHSSSSTKVSLRAQTLNGDKLKVNDKGGNPIETHGFRRQETISAAHSAGPLD